MKVLVPHALALIFVATAAALWIFGSPECAETPQHAIMTTMVMPAHTYARSENWARISASVALDPHVAEFVVTWLNPDDPPPTIHGARVEVRGRSLAQRFNVSNVKTPYVTLIDDDMLVDRGYHRRLLYAASQTTGLTGHHMRGVSKSGTYYNHCGHPFLPDCTLVLTKFMVVPTWFLRSFLEDTTAVAYIDAHQNCEDIFMNYHVRQLTGTLPTFVPLCGAPQTELNSAAGLSTTRPNWSGKRSKCARWARKHYGLPSF